MTSKRKKEFRDILIIIAVFICFRSSILNWYTIPTGSMHPTLMAGDHVMVNKLSYGLMLPFMHTRLFGWDEPKRGDVMVFRDKHDQKTIWAVLFPRNLIKRVIGIGGDHVSFTQGVLTINGVPLKEELQLDRSVLTELKDEDYSEVQGRLLYKESGASKVPHYVLREAYGGITNTETRTWVIPPNKLLVMGDNRDGSLDGRFFGLLDVEDIYGRAFLVTFSIKNWNFIIPEFRPSRWFMPITN